MFRNTSVLYLSFAIIEKSNEIERKKIYEFCPNTSTIKRPNPLWNLGFFDFSISAGSIRVLAVL